MLFSLCRSYLGATVNTARDTAKDLLSEYCETEYGFGNTVLGFLKGGNDYTVMLDAHIDEVGFIVTGIDENGFLTVSNAGGIDIRMLPSRRVAVHTKSGKIPAVFCSVPPHLKSGETDFSDIENFKIDSLLGKNAKDIISLGDSVTFDTKPELLGNGLLTAKSLDDRAGVACLIEVAKRLKDKKLPVNVAFALSDGEELGLRGIRPAAFKIEPQEALAVDVTFGDGIGISEEECGKLGGGAMIGFAPCLDSSVSKKLCSLAEKNNIPFDREVMGEHTGTNADMIAISREGVKTCTVSIPLRNMHTDCEIVDIKDIENTASLICEYILSGGVMNG